MTKKDYKKIAEILKEAKDMSGGIFQDEMLRFIVNKLKELFRYDNSMFNPMKFEEDIYGEKK